MKKPHIFRYFDANWAEWRWGCVYRSSGGAGDTPQKAYERCIEKWANTRSIKQPWPLGASNAA